MTSDELDEYARVVLEVGLDLRPGKVVAVNAMVEHAPFVRALCEQAYAGGARYVDVWYWEPQGKAARLRHAPAETLREVPAWLDARYRELAAVQGTIVNVVGDPAPDLLADADPARAGLDRMPGLQSRFDVQADGEVEWTFACCPTAAWAQRVLGEPDVERLWQHIRRVMRLDAPDPVAAWKARMAELHERCARLTEEAFSAMHLQGEDTNLTVGLLPRHRWGTAELVSRAGIRHIAALPTEEIYTTPDPTRTSGTVAASRPLALGGTVVRDLQLDFAEGRIVAVRASAGADVVRGHLATDDGASLLGEIALVDDSSPLQQSGILFYETLLDESAASHLAWGSGIPDGHQDYDPQRPGSAAALPINRSATHTDFCFGGPGVDVTAIRAGGERVPLMRGERWVL
ncbi:MAG: aminopeptidase [Conexibacter sp.]|nr:aminopeptidase [Conexibacter sp.]